MYAASKLRDPHTQQLNLVIERTLARDTTLSISGTRSRGFKLTTLNDGRLLAPRADDPRYRALIERVEKSAHPAIIGSP